MADMSSFLSLLLIHSLILACFNMKSCSGFFVSFTRREGPLSRIEDTVIIRKEIQGNLTFECTSSGPCLPCTYTEKGDDEKYHCSTSGYRQSNKCIEVQARGLDDSSSQQQQGGGSSLNEGTKRVLDGDTGDGFMQEGFERVNQGYTEHSNSENHGGREERKVFEVEDVTEDGRRVYHMFMSCLPADEIERLSVLGFEGVVFGLLVVSATFVLYRKRRSIPPSGMTRVPSNARF